MYTRLFGSRYILGASGLLTGLGVLIALVALAPRTSRAGVFDSWFAKPSCDNPGCSGCDDAGCKVEHRWVGEPGGTWYWLRSPEEERKTIIGLFNRYCIRCHGVDGRGVWDIPGVPDFTNPRFQACRSDGQLVRAILEGRGAVMPPFRGTLTLEEGWGMARYLRTFLPGTETSRPDDGPANKEKLPMPKTDPGAGKKPVPGPAPSKPMPPAEDKKGGTEKGRTP